MIAKYVINKTDRVAMLEAELVRWLDAIAQLRTPDMRNGDMIERANIYRIKTASRLRRARQELSDARSKASS